MSKTLALKPNCVFLILRTCFTEVMKMLQSSKFLCNIIYCNSSSTRNIDSISIGGVMYDKHYDNMHVPDFILH